MDQLKIMQTVPAFTMYSDEMKKNLCIIILYQPLNKFIFLLLCLQNEQVLLEKFYANAALHIGGKSTAQVRGKLQKLVKKYSEKSKEKTGKGTSKWPYYSLMNKIFGNRENVHSEFLIDSTRKHYDNNVNNEKERKKKKKLSEDDLSYIKSVETISESKKISAESRKKWIENHSTIECERFEFKKKYKALEYELKKKEVDARIKVENEKLDLEKQIKINFELKLKELNQN
ncbi:hypothetical protein F8M41_016558 [Gigaspora margarita]|uniref:Uncharacterized protein n=1 Tax=Gigaspora margarita TaxID=4874 RepID=A0A8H4AP86_GIGMA|nr:hypothetical protein F8M41_016558 [Gigaspora margarita]